MIGFILAAGFGTRLQPITNHLPKALVSVAGKPLLARSIQFLKSQGIDNIGVNSHYLHDQMECFRKNSHTPFELFHEEKIRGTGGALYFAKDFLYSEDMFVIINVDIVCKIDLLTVVEHFKKTSLSCMLVAFPSANNNGSIIYDQLSGDYIGIPAENPNQQSGCKADFIGLALYRKEFLELLTEDDFSIVPLWSRAFKQGMRTGVYLISNGYWRDIGTAKSLAQIHFDTITRTVDLDIPENLMINSEKKYCIPKKIDERLFSRLKNAWVETESIGSGSKIENSVILDKCIIHTEKCISNSLVTPWGVIQIDK